MSDPKRLLDLLVAPGNVALERNADSVRTLLKRASELTHTELREVPGSEHLWHLPERSPHDGPRLRILPSRHAVVYGTHGRRILCADPSGTILHECEWALTGSGAPRMARARVRLDCLQWVGIQAESTEQVHRLEVPPPRTGEERTPDLLRQMAARAWQVPLEDLRYFYPDESFVRDDPRHLRVRLKKDGLYFLEDGTFHRPRFVSYMGAIPWARIDLLNVVELYQSTLPGTGGAVFELLWGLCADQLEAEGPIPLRYRGLPTFPSRQAYGLFCAFFRPEAPPGEDPYKLFLDTQRAYEIAWWLRPDPPRRYFEQAKRFCVTVQGGTAQKVTVIDDPIAVPYVNPGMKGFAPCGRTVTVFGGTLQLRDGSRLTEIPVDPLWGISRETAFEGGLIQYPFDWRSFFGGAPPEVDPVRAWTTALFFPENESAVGEESTQLFALEQAYAYLNRLPDVPSRLARIHRVLIHNFDPVCAGFVDPDNRPRRYTILYSRPEWAQKNAQVIWDRSAREGRLEAVRQVEFLPEDTLQSHGYLGTYELIYRWIPYDLYHRPSACEAESRAVAQALAPGGFAFVTGPPPIRSLLPAQGLRMLSSGGPEELGRLPAMVEHVRLHPRTRINPQLTFAWCEKSAKEGQTP